MFMSTKFKILAVLVSLSLTLCFMSNTYSRYVANTTGNVEVRFARWQILVNENDIFILTSLWEGLPISLLEAMFLEKVCLVTDVIGNRDVIKNNNNGYIINENNYKNIIREIDIEKYYEITQKAKKTIEQDLNTKKMCESYKKIYNI